ncbi:MAG: hypothetical protein ACFWTJ_11295 [Lachnoclostridium sp.]|jgi:hypothetical protein
MPIFFEFIHILAICMQIKKTGQDALKRKVNWFGSASCP